MDVRKGVLAVAAAGAGLGLLARGFRSEHSVRGCAALVTGGSRGLGFLIARELLCQGARVAICARDEEELSRAADRLSAFGEVVPVVCDVAERSAVDAMVRGVLGVFGRIDILVNNAAIINVGPAETLTVDDLEEAMEVDFWGVVHTTLAVLPVMNDQGAGRIANITSIGGKVSIPHLLPYSCGKFAAVAFSEGLAAELSGSGIHVTTIVPGLMRTGSPLHVRYGGQPEKEFLWFAAGETSPFTSMSAERAAERIVCAIRRREREVTLTWQASLLRMAHGIMPGTVVAALGLANRLLPSSGDAPRWNVGTRMEQSAPDFVRRPLDRAARAANQRAHGTDATI